jgi:hypothetical protein
MQRWVRLICASAERGQIRRISRTATPLAGFKDVLTRAQWKGVADFSRAVNAEIVTSFATSDGTRNAQGVWTPEQARAFLAYNKSIGGRIAAVEFMNEPNFGDRGGAPRGYDAAAFARDVAVFVPFLKQTAPGILFLGPGSVMEGGALPVPANAGSAPRTFRRRPGRFTTFFRITCMQRSRSAARAVFPALVRRQRRHYRSNGCPGPTRSMPSTWACATGLNLASKCRSPKQPMPRAEAIPGQPRSSMLSGISTNMQGWRRRACR